MANLKFRLEKLVREGELLTASKADDEATDRFARGVGYGFAKLSLEQQVDYLMFLLDAAMASRCARPADRVDEVLAAFREHHPAAAALFEAGARRQWR